MSMKPKEVLQAPKVVTKAGDWKVITGKATAMGKAFPIARDFTLRLGRNWHWRVDQVEAGAIRYRLLTAYHGDTQEYRAWLAMPRGDSHVIVAQLEFHGTHPGWHCHIACCDLEDVEPGRGHPRSARRFPGGNSRHRRQDFNMSDSAALAKAFEFFNVTGTPDGSLI
jgi:hypothetical protein